MNQQLVTTKVEHGVATVRMQDSDSKNSFTPHFLREFRQALENAVTNPDSRVILLCGLPDVFCSGAPIELLRDLKNESLKPSELSLPRELFSLPLPVISAMVGHATGGGLAAGICADFVVIARESRYGANFMNMGFTPGMGMTRLLEHVLIPALAQEMLFTGAYYKGSFFESSGGFNRVVTKAEVEDTAMDLALQIADKPRIALEMLKQTLAGRRLQNYEIDFLNESLMHEVCFKQPDILETIENNYA
jgi:polyketide biosynthesis enoyl-CoA hydratase PksI